MRLVAMFVAVVLSGSPLLAQTKSTDGMNDNVVSHEDRELALENERLRRENRILREERDILKKATQFFASQKP